MKLKGLMKGFIFKYIPAKELCVFINMIGIGMLDSKALVAVSFS